MTLKNDDTALSGAENRVSVDLEDDAAHLSAFRAPELDAGDTGADAVVRLDDDGAPLDDEPQEIGREAFYLTFAQAFNMPGLFAPDWQPLAIQPNEEPVARAASDGIYSLLEIWYPQALTPNSPTFAALAQAAPFLIAKVMVVRAILEDRRARQLAQIRAAKAGPAQAQNAPANQNASPPPGGGAFAWMGEEQAV